MVGVKFSSAVIEPVLVIVVVTPGLSWMPIAPLAAVVAVPALMMPPPFTVTLLVESTVTTGPGVPVSVPVVTYRPGDASLLVVGARINVVVEKRGEALVLTRVTAGRNGFVPPM